MDCFLESGQICQPPVSRDCQSPVSRESDKSHDRESDKSHDPLQPERERERDLDHHKTNLTLKNRQDHGGTSDALVTPVGFCDLAASKLLARDLVIPFPRAQVDGSEGMDNNLAASFRDLTALGSMLLARDLAISSVLAEGDEPNQGGNDNQWFSTVSCDL